MQTIVAHLEHAGFGHTKNMRELRLNVLKYAGSLVPNQTALIQGPPTKEGPTQTRVRTDRRPRGLAGCATPLRGDKSVLMFIA